MIRKSDIRGIEIPNRVEALKATLFADDTTVYLAAEDDFAILQCVLDKWCSAAKAKFNISKTEIIPIGEPKYRKQMVETYHCTGRWGNYPQNVHMAGDGDAVRILGAYFGNGLDDCNVWSVRLAKLEETLKRWKMGHTSLEGKRHVAQMFVAGMTQFLTDVQRMPGYILKRLNTVIRNYIWDDKHNTPVAMTHLHLPVEKGGIKLIDLEARNEAIDLTWLRSYLSFGEGRPLWA
ncbi:hypothetical protein C8Q73DRAFT_624057, partial [Cubamyces lactineus]